MVNMLAYSDVHKRFRIITYTSNDSSINVHMDNRKVLTFEEASSRLYIYNLDNDNTAKANIKEYTHLQLGANHKNTIK